MAKIPLALQLYTVRDELAKDYAGTVRKVAEMGYPGVEFAGAGNLSAEETRDLLQETGLGVAGYHTSIEALETQFEDILCFCQIIGSKYVGLAYLPEDYRTVGGYRKAAQFLNKYGAVFKEVGLELYYHNHAFEFETLEGGQRGIDILYNETIPELVKLEIDVYWVQYAGESPAELIEAHSGRFPLIHLKDMTAGEGEQRTFAEVGEGILDFEPIFRAAEANGAAWYIVEQDRCAGPSLESARISLQNLKKWGKA